MMMECIDLITILLIESTKINIKKSP